ncbi:MAG: tetratricopeptide repeat protein [Nitrospinales bacterium]
MLFRNSRGLGWLPVGLLVSALAAFTAQSAEPPGHPRLSPSPRQMAEFQLLQKRYDAALKSFTAIVEKGGADGYVFRGLVNAYRGANRQADGEAFLKNYLQQSPDSSPALYGLGYLYYLENRNEEAERSLRRAVDADPQNALALNNLGAALSRKKDFAEAVRSVKKAIELDPGELMFFRNLKLIYDAMNLPSRFADEFEAYQKSGPPEIADGYGKTLATVFRQRGFRFFSEGNLDEAIKSFENLISIYREIDHASGIVAGLFSLGLLYEEKGDRERAMAYYRDVLKISPNHIQAREKLQAGQPKP